MKKSNFFLIGKPFNSPPPFSFNGTGIKKSFFCAFSKGSCKLGTFLKILLPFKNKNYFTLDNLSKHGHITSKFVGRYLGCYNIFQKIGLF